jgi:hypothetical protein
MMRAAPGIAGGLALAACNAMPANWLEPGYVAGEAKSACTLGKWDEAAMAAPYPSEITIGSSFAGWESTIRAQAVTCDEDSDFLSSYAWAECRLTAPAVLSHPMGSHTSESALHINTPGQVLLRASFDGVSCRKLS